MSMKFIKNNLEIKNKNPYILFFLFLIGLLIYSNSLTGEFVSDDYGSILANKTILTNFNIREMWKAYDTRIVGGLSFALNYCLNKESVVGYHIFNVIVHVLNSFLVYMLILQIFQTPRLKERPIAKDGEGIALLSSLIFLVHPIQTQSVTYIVQRYTSLASFFYLSSMLAYGKARLKNIRFFYFLSFLFFLLCILTKEIGFTLPLMIITYTVFFWDSTRSDLKRLGIFITAVMVLISFILSIAMSRVSHDLFSMSSHGSFPGIWNYLLTEINVLRTYFSLLLFPVNQSLSYDYSIASNLFDVNTLASVILLTGIIVLGAWLYSKKYRYLCFAMLWFFVTLSVPVAFAVIYGKNGAGLLYDHWLYLPMVGFSFFIVSAAHDLFGIGNTRKILSILIVILCLMTFQRNKAWQTETGIWEDTVKKYPGSILNKFALGCAYQRKGRYYKAYNIYEELNEKYIDRDPNDLTRIERVYLSRSYNNLGIVSYLRGRDKKSIESFKKALLLQPSNTDAAQNLRLTKINLNKNND